MQQVRGSRFIFHPSVWDIRSGTITFHYEIAFVRKASMHFREQLVFPKRESEVSLSDERRELLANTLSLILGISYWKLYCPKRIEI
ncbi:MAG: hypothetical protein Q7S76_01870, partial [bacterium]|nr:hypothetical protein [bacterium]